MDDTLVKPTNGTELAGETPEQIGDLRAWMKANGIGSQTELAEAIGVDDATLSRFISRKRPFTAEFKLAFTQRYGTAAARDALGVDLPD